MNKLIQRSFLNSAGIVAYISLIGTIMRNGSKIFGEADTFLSPILFLTLFVLSAGITASLALGKPILMYLDGEKSDAVKLFAYTLGWLAVAVILTAMIMLFMVSQNTNTL